MTTTTAVRPGTDAHPGEPTEQPVGRTPAEPSPWRWLRGRHRRPLLGERMPLYVILFCLGLMANLFSSHSQRLGVPVSPDRALIPLALLLLAFDRHRPRGRWGLVGALMVALVSWTLVSMSWYGNLLSPTHVFALLDRMLIPLLLFLAGPLLFSDTARRDVLLKTLVLMGLYLGVTGVLEIVAPQLVFPRYIMDPQVGLHFGRARGPFAGAEAMAISAAVCAGAGVLLASRKLPRWQVLGLVVAIIDIFVVVLTTTRSAWVGVFAGLLVALVLSPRLRRFIPAMAGMGAAGAALVLIFMPSLVESIFERSRTAGPIYDRLSSNAAAMRMLSERPLTGIGWRRFWPDGAEWARQSDSFPMNNAVIEVHNVILSRAAELGLPAATVFIAIILLGPVRAALPARTAASDSDLIGWRVLCGYVVTVWLVAGLFGPVSNPFPNYSVWLIAGVAGAGFLTWPRSRPVPAAPSPSPTPGVEGGSS